MPEPKVIVPCKLDPHDLSTVYLAVCARAPRAVDWHPAYRDLVDDRPVVWIRSAAADQPGVRVWLRDSAGVRRVTPMRRT